MESSSIATILSKGNISLESISKELKKDVEKLVHGAMGSEEFLRRMSEALRNFGLELEPDSLFAYKVMGGSMELAGLLDGDWVVGVRTEDVGHGDIIVLGLLDAVAESANKPSHYPVEGKIYERMIKKLAVNMGKLQLWSFDNRQHPVTLERGDEFQITGKAVFRLPKGNAGSIHLIDK